MLENEEGMVVGIEVKLSGAVRGDDLGGLKHLESLAKSKYGCGIILYTGTKLYPLGKKTWAVPLPLLWQKHW